ncbi:hypothetical protein J6590_053933 [Homalodisca vitripennis]|nr:hypothetical protein J6590_053933 [Homalodisca vitripennis]
MIKLAIVNVGCRATLEKEEILCASVDKNVLSKEVWEANVIIKSLRRNTSACRLRSTWLD